MNPSTAADTRNRLAKRKKRLLGRLARLRKLFPSGPVRGDAQSVVDYDRGDR